MVMEFLKTFSRKESKGFTDVHGGGGIPTHPAKPSDLLNGTPSLYRGMHLLNDVNSK